MVPKFDGLMPKPKLTCSAKTQIICFYRTKILPVRFTNVRGMHIDTAVLTQNTFMVMICFLFLNFLVTVTAKRLSLI
jgi:hypothetical protein